MTKAELMKADREERQSFVKKATAVITEKAMELMPKGAVKTMTFKISFKNGNRYLDFHRHCEDLRFQVFGSGDVDVILHEFVHEDVRIRLVKYEDAKRNPEDILSGLKKDVSEIIDSYYYGYWHAALDYMEYYKEGDDWRALFREYRENDPDHPVFQDINRE